jgi:hypothetical protein
MIVNKYYNVNTAKKIQYQQSGLNNKYFSAKQAVPPPPPPPPPVRFVQISGTRVYTSNDAITWDSYLLPTAFQGSTWRGVERNNADNVFVAVASSGTNKIITSSDGLTWTVRYSSTIQLWDIIYSSVGGSWYAVGGLLNADGFTYPRMLKGTSDGLTWNTVSLPNQTTVPIRLNRIASSSTRIRTTFLAGTNFTYTSTDGSNWTYSSLPSMGGASPRAIGSALGRWVVVGNSNYYATSTDGTTWTTRSLTGTWSRVAGNTASGYFGIYGNGVLAWASPDDWVFTQKTPTQSVNDIKNSDIQRTDLRWILSGDDIITVDTTNPYTGPFAVHKTIKFTSREPNVFTSNLS